MDEEIALPCIDCGGNPVHDHINWRIDNFLLTHALKKYAERRCAACALCYEEHNLKEFAWFDFENLDDFPCVDCGGRGFPRNTTEAFERLCLCDGCYHEYVVFTAEESCTLLLLCDLVPLVIGYLGHVPVSQLRNENDVFVSPKECIKLQQSRPHADTFW